MIQRAKDAYTKRGDGGKEKASTNTDTDLTSPPCKRRSQTLPCKSKLLFCCFCGQEDIDKNLVAAGTYHARSTKANLEHVKHLKDKWIEMVKVVGKDNLLMILSSGDAAVNELYYHKQNSCYQSFRGAYLLKIKTPAIVDEHRKWYKDSALNKILYYIKVCTWKFSLIMMSNTQFMCLVFRTNWSQKMITFILYILKIISICFKSTVASLVSHMLDTSNFLKLVRKVVIPIQLFSIGKVDNELSNKVNLENQLHSVPIPLLELMV